MWLALLLIISSYFIFLPTLAHQTADTRYRVDCAPRPGDSQKDCLNRGCIWDPVFEADSLNTVPFCYFPKNTGYNVKSESAGRLLLQKSSQGAKNPYGEDFAELDLTYKQIGSALKVSIGKGNRYIPPIPLNENQPTVPSEKFLFKYQKNPVFSFTVERNSTLGDPSTSIWNTSIENIHQELKHNFENFTTWGLFARDDAPNSKDLLYHNYYGVHPFYLGVEPDGKAHGVFIFNSNAQEVTTGPGPHLIYRTIGGQLDIFFFPGPRPEQVLQQYHQLIGRPILPAYWYSIDVAYADIDYMEMKKDFTYGAQNWSDFPVLAQRLHQEGMHLILIFDPAIQVDYEVFERALQKNASFIKWPRKDLVPRDIQDMYPLAKNTTVMLGKVWPERHVAFPDFLDPTAKTSQWWTDEFVDFHKKLPFDGIWIDMNEPSNFQTNNNNISVAFKTLKCPLTGSDSQFDNPVYATASAYNRDEHFLSQQTLCLIGQVGGGELTHYDTHNLYGWSETVSTAKAMTQATGKRGAVISRSTFPGSGNHGGHWLGDNTARWEDLKTTIIGVQEFTFFGIPYVGSDVCGFLGTTNEELCLRWQQLGAFHSFYRNHNSLGLPAQDPAQWKSVAKATREANLFRYQHLPYLYSLHFHASLFGGSVVRPVFFEFPRTVKVIP
uniref:P-type domain-containing protein n=1 Tax=Ditylenchus dipsaci TaxID=166011 RepID=A0A915E5B5_9BILA